MQILENYFENEKKQKIERYKRLNEYVKKDQILFVGSSLMEQFPINELSQNLDTIKYIYNRGVGGFQIADMKMNMDAMVFDLRPSKVFINIGTNDLNEEEFDEKVFAKNYKEIVVEIKEKLPKTVIYILAFFPVNESDDFGNEFIKNLLKIRTNSRIDVANSELVKIADKFKLEFININKLLQDDRGNLKKDYSIEGIHIYPNGYKAVFDALKTWI